MDDLAVRVALVAAAMGLALVTAWYMQRRDRRPGRAVADPGLPPGFYFFSSRNCDTCRSARAMLDRRLGAGGYAEYEWEQHPGIFQRLAVDEVPALMVVGERGGARLFAGRLDVALGDR